MGTLRAVAKRLCVQCYINRNMSEKSSGKCQDDKTQKMCGEQIVISLTRRLFVESWPLLILVKLGMELSWCF